MGALLGGGAHGFSAPGAGMSLVGHKAPLQDPYLLRCQANHLLPGSGLALRGPRLEWPRPRPGKEPDPWPAFVVQAGFPVAGGPSSPFGRPAESMPEGLPAPLLMTCVLRI
ncbi:MAG: hypothetical protein P4L36_10800 [Holophaga sp.]|nr:hypothetical protein [Holophaga sp.]